MTEISPPESRSCLAHRFDTDRQREPRIEPALEERGNGPLLGRTFDEKRKLHKTAVASPEKTKRPSE
jgi:hypothetical protein